MTLVCCSIFFSICGFGDAITFADITDKHIDDTEQRVKTKMRQFITEKSSPMEYFGVYHVDNPDNFEFTLGERIQLKKASSYVQRIINEKGMTTASRYFASTIEKPIEKNFSNPDKIHELTKSHYFLYKLLDAADKNISRKPGGYRYDDDVKFFATYIRNIAGPLAYDTLQRNLQSALPSLSAINKYVHKSNCRVIEGILRSNELRLYLQERNLPFVVSLSEDGTGITNRLQYDSTINQIIGFVSPNNPENGLPVPYSYKARTAAEIESHFKNNSPMASFINVVMAQPMSDQRVPPFCLLLFASDNRYKSVDVQRRWSYIIDELNELGIEVSSFSSDSDPKYNSAMRSLSSLGSTSNDFPGRTWFRCGDYTKLRSTVFVQDTAHIASKMRNFLMKTIRNPSLIKFGKYYIRIQHLQYLVNNFTKDKHNLTPSTVNPIDRQNFEDTVLRICDPKVTELMRSCVVDSQATVKFLELMKNIIDSYTSCTLWPIERIEKIWYSVFMLRVWRDYIARTKGMKLKNNFISTYCYVCIELNAHSLVRHILQLRDTESAQFFLPMLMNSQACESTFRLARSFTSTFSTIVNCSVKEMLSRISKIQMQNDVMNSISDRYTFPQLKRTRDTKKFTQILPTRLEIENQIEMCKLNALNDSVKLGLIEKAQVVNFDDTCKITPYIERKSLKKTGEKHSQRKTTSMKQQSTINSYENLKLKNYAKDFDKKEIEETSPFVEIYSSKCGRRVVKKSSLVWLLRNQYIRVSSDRLLRVRATYPILPNSRKIRIPCTIHESYEKSGKWCKNKKNEIKH